MHISIYSWHTCKLSLERFNAVFNRYLNALSTHHIIHNGRHKLDFFFKCINQFVSKIPQYSVLRNSQNLKPSGHVRYLSLFGSLFTSLSISPNQFVEYGWLHSWYLSSINVKVVNYGREPTTFNGKRTDEFWTFDNSFSTKWIWKIWSTD